MFLFDPRSHVFMIIPYLVCVRSFRRHIGQFVWVISVSTWFFIQHSNWFIFLLTIGFIVVIDFFGHAILCLFNSDGEGADCWLLDFSVVTCPCEIHDTGYDVASAGWFVSCCRFYEFDCVPGLICCWMLGVVLGVLCIICIHSYFCGFYGWFGCIVNLKNHRFFIFYAMVSGLFEWIFRIHFVKMFWFYAYLVISVCISACFSVFVSFVLA